MSTAVILDVRFHAVKNGETRKRLVSKKELSKLRNRQMLK